jgi:3-oxoacyl-[acyl-carrier-protein] synthase-3
MEVLDDTGIKPEDIALLIPHQANLRIINATGERLASEDKVFTNSTFGNTGWLIPLALDEAARQGRIKEGDIVLFVALAGGHLGFSRDKMVNSAGFEKQRRRIHNY